jgi:hypothetical protein
LPGVDPNTWGIGHESGATYSWQVWEGKEYVEVYARTKEGWNGPERKPEWADCQLARGKLFAACGNNVAEWKCEPRWGTCRWKVGVDANPNNCGWGSCVYASFKAGGTCNGGIPLPNVVASIFGPHNCRA